MKFVILGSPRTKKNHGRRIKRGARVYSVPSEAAVAWESSAIAQLKRHWHAPPANQAWPVTVRALVYRDRASGDLVGYLQAIGDALQGGHGKNKIPCVLTDDKQIQSWDGSRLLIDRANPRVEITIEPMDQGQPS